MYTVILIDGFMGELLFRHLAIPDFKRQMSFNFGKERKLGYWKSILNGKFGTTHSGCNVSYIHVRGHVAFLLPVLSVRHH